jgi:hypothetical protein
MENKVVNKQIPIKSIIDIANYFGDYKNRYDNIFEQEKEKNKDLPYSEKHFEHENGSTDLKYTIKFRNGKDMTESDYNWFIEMLNDARAIKEVRIDLRVAYLTSQGKDDFNGQYNGINAEVYFRDARMDLNYSDVYVNVQTTNQESEAHNIYSTIMDTLEDNEDRYNKTIKHRKIRIQSLCIAIGIILSYILYLILRINAGNLPTEIAQYLNNKYVIVFGQWFAAILLGNVFSYWYILSLYKPLLPSTKYAGYNRSTHKSQYTDDIDDYLEHSEIHFGKYWDAENRRNKIEKIYKITSKIVLVQLLISVVLYFVIK